MNVLVIGASGQTGRHVVKRLLAQGHEVTAFVRSASKPIEAHPHLRIAQGDARDLVSLQRAIDGQDAVISCLGPKSFGRTDLQEVFMRNMVEVMTKSRVKRLINLSAWGLSGAAVAPSNAFARYVFLPIVLRHVLADKRRGETHLFASALEYVNVCPAYLKNAPARGGVQASIDGRGLKQHMHREDLAAFMVGQLTENAWLRKCVVIGY